MTYQRQRKREKEAAKRALAKMEVLQTNKQTIKAIEKESNNKNNPTINKLRENPWNDECCSNGLLPRGGAELIFGATSATAVA